MRIVSTNADGETKTVASKIRTRHDGIKRMVELARESARTMPNSPHVDQSGVDEVSVWIGIYRMQTFRLEA